MLRRLLTLGFLLVSGASIARAFSQDPTLMSPNGPIPSVTGASEIGGVDAENTCMLCHGNDEGTNLNPPGGSIEVLDVPAHYSPGQTYSIRVRLSSTLTQSDSNRRWGFQITAVRPSDGGPSGTLIIPASQTTFMRAEDGVENTPWELRHYVMHRFGGVHQGEASPVEWTLDWQAPLTEIGPVFFFVAGNSANGDGSLQDDFIFTGSASTVPEVTPVAIATWGRLKALYR
jgi:hypothetical protein